MKLLLACSIVLGFLCGPSSARAMHRRTHYRFEATAFSLRGITAEGTRAHRGTAAADPRILPLGTLISVQGAGRYSGEYVVKDVGGTVVGARIDLFIPDRAAATRFGKRTVSVRVIRWGQG